MKKKAIVIGGGLGGMAAAVRLAGRGLDVTLFEKRDRLGGRAYVYEINGFKFDGGPTMITAPFLLDQIFQDVGHNRADYFQLTPLDPFYRIFNPEGRAFNVNGDTEAMLKQIVQWNPADQAGYQKYLQATRGMVEKYFFKFSGQPFLRAGDMLKATPDLIQLQSYRSAAQFVAQFVKNDFLHQMFSFNPLWLGGSPFETPSILTLIPAIERQWGMVYAPGGTGSIVDGLAKLLEELGGKVLLNTEVTEILVENRKVTGIRLNDSSIHRADLIVSNADVPWTYKNLIPARYRRRMSDRRMDRYRYSNSLFVIYFGTRRRYLDARLAHHNFILGSRYKELMADIFDRQVLADDFLLQLNMPTLTDPGMAPEGCEAFSVISPVPNLGAAIDWTAKARPYRDRIMNFLEQHFLPDLQANIIAEQYIDPLHFQNTLNSTLGAAYSLAPILSQTAWFRPHNRSEDFDNLFFTGAGTHPGAGMPGVLLSAKIVENLVLEML